jgi:predicted lipoprotein with Yx(FWY)xxD motif
MFRNNPIKRRTEMRRLFVFLPLLIALTLVLAGCPPAAPGGEAAATPEEAVEATEAPEVEASETMTDTEDVTDSEEMTGTEDVTGTEEMTGTEGVGGSEEMTGTEGVGGSEEMTGTEEITGTEETTGTTGSTDTGGAAMAGMVNLSSDADFGEILTDGEGRALYLFTDDTEGVSNCSGNCATAWPPFTVEGEAMAGEGIDQAMLGTITRDDGTLQVTYNGHPLYYYADDVNPGDVTGQGVGDVWYLVNAQGEQVE